MEKELTERQKSVVQMSADGKTAQEIGEKLSISSRSIEYILKDASDAVGAVNKVNLVAICLRKNIIQ